MAPPQILLVDDNPTNLQVLYQTLEGQGYRLLAARSGKDAIAIAERAAPDLILLDVMMPDPDGFETCARLKADARTRDCAITGPSSPERVCSRQPRAPTTACAPSSWQNGVTRGKAVTTVAKNRGGAR